MCPKTLLRSAGWCFQTIAKIRAGPPVLQRCFGAPVTSVAPAAAMAGVPLALVVRAAAVPSVKERRD